MSLSESFDANAETLLRLSQAVDGGLLERMDVWSRTSGGHDDPTADAALTPDRVRADRTRLDQIGWAITDLVDEAHRIATTYDADRWCRSCSRAGVRVPVTRQPNGFAYYVGRCRACGQREAESGRMPSMEWVTRRLERLGLLGQQAS